MLVSFGSQESCSRVEAERESVWRPRCHSDGGEEGEGSHGGGGVDSGERERGRESERE